MRNLTLILCLIMFPFITCFAQTPLDENHVEVSPGVIRVGKDIVYQGEDGKLHLSRPEFVPAFAQGIDYQCETTKLQVYLGSGSSSWPLQLKYRGKLLRMRLTGLGYYNPVSDAFRIIAEPNYFSCLPGDKKAYLSYPEVFPGTKLFYWVFYGGFAPRFILNDLNQLPPAGEKETYLGVMIQLDLASLSPYRVIIELENDRRDVYLGSDISNMTGILNQITATLRTGEITRERRIRIVLPINGTCQPCFNFDDDKVFDSSSQKMEERIHPLRMVKRIEEKDYYLELIPLSWLKAAVYPVSFGTGVTGGSNPNPDEVFLAGMTYVVEGRYNVKSVTSLGEVTNPVCVKFLPDQYSEIAITKKGGLGARIENTIFTSLLDKHPARGANVDPSLFGFTNRPPAPGDYRYALQAVKGGERFLRNCQIYYADTGVTNSEFEAESVEMNNVLIENCKFAGAVLTHWGSFVNTTIRNCNQGVVVGDSSTGEVLNSIFAENQTLGCSALSPNSSNNVWYGNGKDTEDNQYGKNSLTEADGLTNPFTSGPGGDCYLEDDLVDKNGNTLDLSNIGFSYPH